MNRTLQIARLVCIAILGVTLSTCDSDDDNRPPLEQLPEATQTGRGVFGALVNGEAFVETGTFFNTFYQQVDGEFFFGIQGEFPNRNPLTINIATQKRTIADGEILQLIEREDGNAWGG